MKKLFSVSRFSKLSERKNAGFTLIEILVVIGIIALLATIVIVAINPARQFAQARNTQRTSNVNTILNGIGQRIADNKGVFLGVVNSTQTCPDISSAALTVGTSYAIYNGATGGAANSIDLSCVTPTYVPTLPNDPNYVAADGNKTLYEMKIDANQRVTVCAPLSNEAALGSPAAICVTR